MSTMITFKKSMKLYEAKREQLEDQFKGKLPPEAFDTIVTADPTVDLSYSRALLNLYVRSPFKITKEELANVLKHFIAMKNKKKLNAPIDIRDKDNNVVRTIQNPADLGSYKVFEDLYSVVADELKAPMVYEDKNFLVRKLLDINKAYELCGGAFCFVMSERDATTGKYIKRLGKDAQHYWDSYTKHRGGEGGTLYLMMLKAAPPGVKDNDKALWVDAGGDAGEFKTRAIAGTVKEGDNEQQHQETVDVEEFKKNYPETWQGFLRRFYKNKLSIEFKGKINRYTEDEERGIFVFKSLSLDDSEITSLAEFRAQIGRDYIVLGDLDLRDNQLKDLVGGPLSVDGKIDLTGNPIESLAGMPKGAKSVVFSKSKIESITGLPETIKTFSISEADVSIIDLSNCKELASFSVNTCPSIKTLVFDNHNMKDIKIEKSGIVNLGAFPDRVDQVYLEELLIESLTGCAAVIPIELHVSNCKDMKTLAGTQKAAKDVFLRNLPVKTLEGLDIRKVAHMVVESLPIKDLTGGPAEVVGILSLRKCDQLVSLEGSVKSATNVDISACPKLKSVKGIEVKNKVTGFKAA